MPSPVSRPGADLQGQPDKPAAVPGTPGRIQFQLRHLSWGAHRDPGFSCLNADSHFYLGLPDLSQTHAWLCRQNPGPASLLTDRWRLSNVSWGKIGHLWPAAEL